MVDAAASDLLPVALTTSLSASPAKLLSAELCKDNEDSSSLRCLSPVLNSNNSNRKLIYHRKKSRTKSRVRLTKRFPKSDGINTKHGTLETEKVSSSCSGPEDYINNSLSDIQNFKSDQVEDRLTKLREFEKGKRKFLDSLYVLKKTKSYVSNRKPDILSTSDEFSFKKPESPISGVKKFKPYVDVLSQDRKAMHGLVTNVTNKQDYNNFIDLHQPNILDNAMNEKKNDREGNSEFLGFCTGSGKNIIVSPENLRKHLELFGDVLDIHNSFTYSQFKPRKDNVLQKCSQLKNEKTGSSYYELEDFADNEQALDRPQLDNHKDVSFMQTSISDTQLILAVDVALSMMDNKLSVVPPSTNKIVELDSSKTKNDCDVLLSPVKPIFKENQEDKTIEHEMIELEKILNTSIERQPKIADNNNENSLRKSCSDKFTNFNKVERNNKKLILKCCLDYQVPNIVNKQISTTCDEEINFKGFAIDEYNFARQQYNSYFVLMKKMESVIECCSNSVVNKNNENIIGTVVFETDQATSNDLGQVTDANIFAGKGKHTLNNMYTIPNKRFKSGNSKNDNFEKENVVFECGFATASRKPIKMLPSSIKNAEDLYEQVCQMDNTVECCSEDSFKETKKEMTLNILEAGGINIHSKTSTVPTTTNNLMISLFENAKTDYIDISECGFKTVSKKPIQMLPSLVNKAQHIYGQMCKTENPADYVQIEQKENIQLRDIFPAKFTNGQKKISKLEVIPQITNNNITTTNFDISTADFLDFGFKTASRKPIKMSPSALKKARGFFENINMAENQTECNEINKKEILKKSGENILFKDPSSAGFSTAGGKTITISDNAWHKANSVFADEEVGSSSLIQSGEFDELFANNAKVGFNINKPADNKTVAKISNVSSNSSLVSTVLNSSQKTIEEGDLLTTCAAGFTTGSGMKIKISKSALQKSKTLFADEDLSSSMKREEVKDLSEATNTTMTHVPGLIGNDLQRSNKEHYEDQFLKQEQNLDLKFLKSEFSELYHGSAMSNIPNSVNRNSTKICHTKKRLGISACKPILISNSNLRKAKSILEEDLDSNKSGGSRNTNMNTSIRFKQAEIYSSTPLKEASAFKSSELEAEKVSKIIEANTLDNVDITPVKKPYFKENIAETKNLLSENENKSAIIFRKQIVSDIKERLDQFNNEYEDLVYKMKVISERKKILELQEQLIKNADDIHRRQKPGVLLGKKQLSQKILLKNLCGNRKPGTLSVNEAIDCDVPKQVLEVTPKNAKYVNFNYDRKNNGEKYYSTVCTADDAVVIPNASNLISLTEISTAFESMPGVDPRLLPKEWISNHFKWIVWKLASLQRNFPDLFPNWLSVENVIQQLKYRYDREIDQAERPALRRILEKDDIPQKRMVLCVSDVIEVSHNMFELELTDGWYCIQTLIDQPLCKQIVASKIVIGTKLAVQCAEILNCDGCHPLEIPSNVRLKITYNCTRRAAWYSKLGYQRKAAPFPISLRTINSDGGIIALIKIYIARVYPLRYMERQRGKTVWRNKKAEDKQAQEWANAKMREVETIHRKVQEDYEKEMNIAQKNALGRVDCNKISEISSPKLLYQMLENTNDPEGFKNMMSTSQLTSAMDYRSSIYAQHQQEVARRIAEQVKSLKSSNREVTSVLKLRVVDVIQNSEDSFIFNIWKPTEEHLQLLKEGCIFSVYNVFPKSNGDLTANSRTHFKPELPLLSKNNRIQRHIVPISLVQHSVHKPLFNEYDTVGIVVRMHKDIHHQDMWLADSVGRLLRVQILGEPEQCCFLDNLNKGQSIAIMNLIFRHPHDMFGQAFANQCTVITGYPQHKFLQDGLTAHCKELPKDITPLLNQCDKKIEVCLANMHATRNTSSVIGSISTSGNVADLFDDSSEDNTVIPSRLTTTDVAMSLIDTDQFL